MQTLASLWFDLLIARESLEKSWESASLQVFPEKWYQMRNHYEYKS